MARTFTAVFEQHGNWWIGWVEGLPGANAQERTLDEARESLQEVIPLILEATQEHMPQVEGLQAETKQERMPQMEAQQTFQVREELTVVL